MVQRAAPAKDQNGPRQRAAMSSPDETATGSVSMRPSTRGLCGSHHRRAQRSRRAVTLQSTVGRALKKFVNLASFCSACNYKIVPSGEPHQKPEWQFCAGTELGARTGPWPAVA